MRAATILFAETMKRTVSSRTISRRARQDRTDIDHTLVAFAAKAGLDGTRWQQQETVPMQTALVRHIATPRASMCAGHSDTSAMTSCRPPAIEQEPYGLWLARRRRYCAGGPVAPVAPALPTANAQSDIRRDFELGLAGRQTRAQ